MAYEFSTILKKAGLKVTPARKLILDVFSHDCKPINAEHIYEKLRGKNINQVTIYRTLATLENAEIIKKVDLHRDSAFYELVGHHHHHLICTKCGTTEGFEMCDIDEISKEILKKSPLFKSVNQHSLELFGICKPCSKGNK